VGNESTIPCAVCGRLCEYFAEPVGPFCGARCQVIDLSHWINEEYRISEPLRADHFEEYESLTGRALDEREDF
jgi:endogenous inhibitor of DNA gyrase (YacG/DUF329 family)